MKINTFWGDVTDVSAEKEALPQAIPGGSAMSGRRGGGGASSQQEAHPLGRASALVLSPHAAESTAPAAEPMQASARVSCHVDAPHEPASVHGTVLTEQAHSEAATNSSSALRSTRQVCLDTSASFLAGLSVSSPRKSFIFII